MHHPRRRALALLSAAVLALTATASVSTAAIAQERTTFKAPLSAAQEVPTNDSRARGVATFKLSRDGSHIYYRLIVANIEDVTMAHIHLAPAGVNGPVVAWLYPSSPPPALIPGRSNGVLATGTITADDLVGPLAGADLMELVDVLTAGGAYVNVHTATYPGGEIRGQIR
jgi:hypothetical protein